MVLVHLQPLHQPHRAGAADLPRGAEHRPARHPPYPILVYITFILPIVVWICTDQFRSIPKDLEEAARLEGASQFDIFWRIYLPLGVPGIAVSAIFGFIFSWNELLYATSFMSGYELPWGKIMATGTVIVLPVTVFALLVSRHMVRGLTMGATK